MEWCNRICVFTAVGLLVGCSSVFKHDFGADGVVVDVQQSGAIEAEESFVFEAESGQVQARENDTWEVVDLAEASAGKAMRKTGGAFYGEAQLGPGVVWTFKSELANDFDVWGRVRPNPSGDSLFFEWEGSGSEHHWPAEVHNLWVWSKLRSVVVEAEKSYSFAVWAREDSIEVDLIVVQTAGALAPVLPE